MVKLEKKLIVAWDMRLYFVFIGLFIVLNVGAQDQHAHLRKGDHAYDRDQYKEAEQFYRNAADRDVRSSKAVYNLGNALYQQGKFEEAGQRFQQAANREEPASKSALADSWHNLGNSLLKQRKYQEAVKAYEQCLRYRPGDQESKVNLQMAKKKLREEMQRQQDQQNQQQQQNQNQDQNQDPSQQPNQPPPPGKNRQQNPEHQQEEQPSSAPPPSQQQPQQGQQLKKEEVKRLLETAVGNEDRKNARKYRSSEQTSPEKRAKKDW